MILINIFYTCILYIIEEITYLQVLFLKPSNRFLPLNLYFYCFNPLISYKQLVLNPKIMYPTNFILDMSLYQVIYSNIDQPKSLISMTQIYYNLVTYQKIRVIVASVAGFFLFFLLLVNHIYLIIYLIIFLSIHTSMLIYLVLPKTFISYKKPQTIYHILRLYGLILCCCFINTTFSFKIMFSPFIIQYFSRYSRQFFYLLICITIKKLFCNWLYQWIRQKFINNVFGSV